MNIPLRLVMGALVLTAACQKPSGQGPCSSPADCVSDFCFEVARQSYCTQKCGSCPDGMFCDGVLFASSGVAICLEGHALTAPAMPPRLLCDVDTDCPTEMLCSDDDGIKMCAAKCLRDEDCEPLKIGDQTFDFLACTAEQANKDRRACIPRAECRANLSVCVFTPSPMPAARFTALLEKLKGAPGGEKRAQAVMGLAMEKSWFSCEQLIAVMEIFKAAGESNFVAVRSMGPKLANKDGIEKVMALIEAGGDRDEARRILGLNGH